MCLYSRTKFQVSGIVLTSFRLEGAGEGGWNFTPPHTSKQTPKKHTQIRVNSHLPNTYKKGLVDTLLSQAFNICPNYSSFHQEINYLKTVWQKNSFLLFLLTNVFQSFLISYLPNTITKI